MLLKLLNRYRVDGSFEAYNCFGKSSTFKHSFFIHSTQLVNKAKPDGLEKNNQQSPLQVTVMN